MEDRYDIKGKIGQGGLGAVYRAFDARMNREVAIKRIVANSGDASLSEEATRQLLKEAGSLASLQHPNIVTVYDVGADEDGPFVVMELLTGSTLEEIIGQASFTWQDFRQLAMQTQEALIAAQELHLVHRDLKPGNIMLTWLPSGKFHVKIVDFGLAKLSVKPSLQTMDQSDGVFGSIYFMAPEQFERVPLDLKADMYAMGCVYYYALTGTYPFDGETAAEVMAAHLQHHVTPLQEMRDGIPLWACDWVMWLLNRQASDRPESARQALQLFIENDQHVSAPLSSGPPKQAPDPPPRPQLVIPGSAPVPVVIKESTPTQRLKTAAAPKQLAPPQGSKPSVHTTSQVVISAPVQPTAPVISRNQPGKSNLAPRATLGPAPATRVAKKKKPGLSNAAKMSIAALLGLLAALIGVIILKKSGGGAVQTTTQTDATKAAIETTRLMTKEADFPTLLDLILTTEDAELRKIAGENAALIIKNSAARPALGDALISAFKKAPSDPVRGLLLSLLSRIGGENALALAKQNLDGQDPKNKSAAIAALGTWADQSGYKLLIDFIASFPELQLRSLAYDSAIQYTTQAAENQEENWTLLAGQSKTQDEKFKFIRGIETIPPAPWAIALLENLIAQSDAQEVTDLAEKALARLKNIK
ncbi:MAG: serine/threonine protein kinase [Armatimonadetes bacterium]|nr:serine/threonine protein kinase [Akkermansiaceae bacterium]